jgi:hypothetical protein
VSGINNLGQYAMLKNLLNPSLNQPGIAPDVTQMPYNPYPPEGQG